MNIGPLTKRAKLRMTILRGGVGQRPNRISETHPVAASNVIDSGMVMTLNKNSTNGRLEWVKGATGDVAGQFFFAVDDSWQGDVLAAGNLQGLSANEAYQLQVAHFTGTSFAAGDRLVPDEVTAGNLRKEAAGDQAAGRYVVAIVSLDYAAPVDLGPVFTDQLPNDGDYMPKDADVSPGVQGGTYVIGKASNAEDLSVIRITTLAPQLALI